MAQTLVKLGSAPESWVDILDAITVSTDGLEYLRLDVNRASFEAIAALPGLSPEQAQQIVDRRAILTPEELQTPLWPMLTGIVTKEQFVPLADVLSVRSWTWRFRIAAGEVSADDPDGPMTATNSPSATCKSVSCSA